MKLVRTVFITLAVLLPVSWTVAQAADPMPPVQGAPDKTDKTDKKDKKAKKTDAPVEGDHKSETKTDKK